MRQAQSARTQGLMPVQKECMRETTEERRHLRNRRECQSCRACRSWPQSQRRCSNPQQPEQNHRLTSMGYRHDPWGKASGRHAHSRCLGRQRQSRATRPKRYALINSTKHHFSATGLTCFIFRFLSRPLTRVTRRTSAIREARTKTMGLSPFWLYMLPETGLPRISRNEHQSPSHQASCKPRLDFGLNSKPAGIELFPHFGNVVPAMPSSLCGPCPCRW